MNTPTATLQDALRRAEGDVMDDDLEDLLYNSGPWDAGDNAAEILAKHIREIEAMLQDPIAVHAAMLRRDIKWTPEKLRHLLGDYAQEQA